MTTYVDLEDSEGIIRDTAAFDDSFWQANEVAFMTKAAAYGKTLSVRTAGPGYAVVTISNMVQFDSWVSVSETSAPPVTGPTGGGVSSGAVVAVVGGGILLATALALAAR